MAKWGEGDPRWIVEERADATNVNNWHWTEKNASDWSKEKLRSLLEGLKIEDDKYCCEINELTSLEGEAMANNRKSKLIFFYEWVIKAEWKGSAVGSDNIHKGKLEIPNLSEENSAEDIDVVVTANTDKEEAYNVKEFIRKVGSEKICDQLSKYVADLREEFSQGMILPGTKAPDKKPTAKVQTKNIAKEELSKPVTLKQPDKSKLGVHIACSKITDKQTFKCRGSDVYRALTEKDMVRAFTRNEADIKAETGYMFSLFNGNVTGKFTCLKPFEKISMQWRFKTWPDEHFSSVCLDLEEKDDCTELTLTQTGVPTADVDRTREGWSRYYWQGLKQTFGFGANLF